MNLDFLGYVAAVCTTVSFLPQAFKIIKSKKTNDISLIMYSILVIGVILWTIYGIYMKDWSLILANAITSVSASVVLVYKIRNVIKGESI
ncbi:MAG: SemiSWEET transporter [Bacilli bacterium]|nr:SemiSWEET transporter [Bacilli bacterium]